MTDTREMELAGDESEDKRGRRKRIRRIILLVVTGGIAVLVVTIAFLWYALSDPFLDRELDGLEAPPGIEFVGSWRTSETLRDLLNEAYVTNFDIRDTCEAMSAAVEDWGGRDTAHPSAGFHLEQEQCLAQFTRRSVWSLFQASTISVSARPLDAFHREYGGVPSFGDEPAPDLPEGFQTVVVITIWR